MSLLIVQIGATLKPTQTIQQAGGQVVVAIITWNLEYCLFLFPIASQGDNQNREQGQKHRDKIQTGRTFQGDKRPTTATKVQKNKNAKF